MLAFLKKNRGKCQTILVEKTDRLYRNVPDYATVDELGVTIHFVKDGTILSPDSKSSEQFIHGIKVLMARNYSQNLGEETLKGMRPVSEQCAGRLSQRGGPGRQAHHCAGPRCSNDHAFVCGIRHRPVFPENSSSQGKRGGLDGRRSSPTSEHPTLDPSQAHLHR